MMATAVAILEFREVRGRDHLQVMPSTMLKVSYEYYNFPLRKSLAIIRFSRWPPWHPFGVS